MPPPLSDQVALVTGASRGIGRSIATSLAACGAHVFAPARTTKALDELVDEITENGGQATSVTTDVGDEADVAALFAAIRDTAGQLDILVNNAGVGVFQPLADTRVEDLDRIFAVNVRGTFLCSQQALALMVPRRQGYIINIGSVVSFKGYPEQAAYTASKHAQCGLTKSRAAEAQAHSIRVSAILPGGVDTDLIGQARPDLDRSGLMQPEDIAQSVLYLLSLSDRAAVDEIYIRRKSGTPF